MTDLSREDVLQILELIDKAHYDFFELQMGELKLTVSKVGPIPDAITNSAAPTTERQNPTPAPVAATTATAPAAPPAAPGQPTRPARDVAAEEGLVQVKAPMVGTFYAQPEPGAPPYVQLGSRVDEDTTMGLVEVMKVFNSVRAGARGVVAKILVQNAQFVEYGETLFLILPDEVTEGDSQ